LIVVAIFILLTSTRITFSYKYIYNWKFSLHIQSI